MHVGTRTRYARCGKTAEFNEEHLIPEAIGGKLTCKFLCMHCNSQLGDELEAKLKEDARIRLAIENLKEILPDLWARMSENQPYTVQSADRKLGARLKRGEIRPDSSNAKMALF